MLLPQLLPLYRTMHLIRAFEEAAGEAFRDGRIRGPVHQYVGQEAIATGVCANLRPTDYIASYHRGHGHAIAKGAAQAVKLLRQDRVVVAFFGDGAVNRGPLLEAFNWAMIYRLPVLFVCEDNEYAATVRTSEFTAGEGIVARARSFGIPCESIDGNDVAVVSSQSERFLREIRNGKGPALIHALAYRWYGHFAHDSGAYRDPEAHRKALERDPLERCRRMLLKAGASIQAMDDIREEMHNLVAAALREAEAAPLPAPETAFTEIQDLDAAWLK